MKTYQCCNNVSITKKYYCPECGGNEFTENEISDHGTIYSYTKIHIAPAEFEGIAPYNVVLVDLAEAKCKVTTRILEDVAIGDKVTLDRVEDGAYIYRKL